MRVRCFFVFFGLVIWGTCQALTLVDICKFVANLDEDVQPLGRENWLDPDFSHVYDQLFSSNWRGRFLPHFGIAGDLFSPKDFLKALSGYQVKQGVLQKQADRTFLQVKLALGSQVVVIGDLHGAIHSFARMLVSWFLQGLISDDLRVQNPNIKFVFLGDYLNRSPYGLFLLPLLIEFSNQNPNSVFLLRGRQEREGYWEQFLASRSFLRRLSRSVLAGDLLPLAPQINNFFAQLYDGLVCEHESSNERIVVSHHALPYRFVPNPNSIAHVKGEMRTLREVSGRGLLFDQFTQGTATWNVFSAPVPVYSRLGILERDSYAQISVGSSYSSSTITGFESDRVRILSDMPIPQIAVPVEEYRFSLAYGHEVVTPEEEEALLRAKPWFICSSVALSGGLRGMGYGLKEGVTACCIHANKLQKVPGYCFRPVFLDDQYEPDLMEHNVQVFRAVFGADSMLVAMGSPTVSKIVPLIERENFVLFFPATGSPLFRDAGFKNMIHIRHSYAEEVYPLLDRIAKVYGAKRFAFVYQDDSFGAPLTKVAVEYLRKHAPGVFIQTIPVLRGHTPSPQAVAALNEFNPEAIGLFVSTQLQLSGFADRLGIGFLLGKYLFAIDFSTDIFREFAERWGVQIMQASSFESAYGTYGKLMDDYRYTMRLYRYPLSITSVEGFIAASLYLEALSHSYPNVSSRAIKDKLEQLDTSNILGESVGFDPRIRSFTGPVWITDRGVLYRAKALKQGYDFIRT